MKSPTWFVVVVVLLGCFLVFRPPIASVTAADEHHEELEQEVQELERLIEKALDAGDKGRARELRRELGELLEVLEEREDDEEEEWDEEEWDEARFERELRELELRHHAMEVEMAEMELKLQRLELLSNPLATSLDAIDLAGQRMEPEEAAEFFSDLLEESSQFPVKQALRQRLVELNFELDRDDEAVKHLRALIVPSDD